MIAIIKRYDLPGNIPYQFINPKSVIPCNNARDLKVTTNTGEVVGISGSDDKDAVWCVEYIKDDPEREDYIKRHFNQYGELI